MQRLIAKISGSFYLKLLIVILLCCLIPMLLISFAATYTTRKVVREKEIAYVTDKLQSVTADLNTIFSDIDVEMNSIMASKTVLACLESDYRQPSLEWHRNIMTLNETLAAFSPRVTRTIRYSYSLIGADGTVYSDGSKFNWLENIGGELARSVLEGEGSYVLLRRKTRDYMQTELITVGKAIRKNERVLGVLLVDLELSTINRLFLALDDSVNICIFANRDERIYERAEVGVYSDFVAPFREDTPASGTTVRIDGRPYLYLIDADNTERISSVALIPLSEIYRSSRQLFFYLVETLVVMILVIAVVARVFAKSLTVRILGLNRRVAAFAHEGARREIRMEIGSRDEIGQLAEGVCRMSAEIVDLLDTRERNQREKRLLEMQSLQAQIDPHMTYNTLNTITYLARLQGVENIAEVSPSFGRMLRILFTFTDPFLTLEQEIGYLKNYIAIKQYQLLCNLNVRYDVSPDALGAKILKLLLQPFVENALSHGFAGVTSNAELRIRARREGGYLHVTISDNGIGMSEEKRAQIRQLEFRKEMPSVSVGIQNCVQRLRLQYGDRYTFDILPGDPGTVISIRYPDA